MQILKLRTSLLAALLAFFMIGAINTARGDDCLIGSSSTQDWYAASCDKCSDCETKRGKNPVKTITGTIGAIRVNENVGGICPASDLDWNIFVIPDPQFDWILTNRGHHRNHMSADALCGITVENPLLSQIETGSIELEVKSTRSPLGADLASYFPQGEHITAKGYWVEDSGHADKTELHPLIYMKSGTTDYQTIFVAQDRSGRFVTAEWPIFESFTFDLEPSGKRVLLVEGRPTARYWSGTLLREESFLDHYNEITESSRNSRSKETINMRSDGLLSLSVELNPILTYVPLRPVYLGTWDKRRDRPVLDEQFDYKIVTTQFTGPDGMQRQGKKLEANVTVTLIPPFDDLSCISGCATSPIKHSLWSFEESHATGNKILVNREIEDATKPHSVKVYFVYWPEFNFNHTTWALNVTGSTRPKGWSPGDDSIPQTGLNGPFKHTFVHDQRLYFITPSRIALQATPKKGTSRVDTPSIGRICTIGHTVTLEEDLIPGVNLRKVVWQVQLKQKADGSPVSDTPKDIPTTGPTAGRLSVSLATIEIDPNNEKRAIVSFKDMGWVVTSDGDWMPKNKTRVMLIANTETELGEKPVAFSEELGIDVCSNPPFLTPAVQVLLDDLERAMSAAIWLNNHGLLPKTPPWPEDQFSQTQIERIVQAFPSGLRPLGDREHTLRQLPRAAQPLYEAWRELKKGTALERLSPDKQRIVQIGRRSASSLPKRQTIEPVKGHIKYIPPSGDIRPSASTRGSVPKREEERPKTVSLEGVAFLPGKTELRSQAKAQLDELVWRLKPGTWRQLKVRVLTRERNDQIANKSLSQKRAATIRKYLTKRKIEGSRIILEGAELPRAQTVTTSVIVKVDIL